MNSKTGMEKARYADALDLLEAVIFAPAQLNGGYQPQLVSPQLNAQTKTLCGKCGTHIPGGDMFCTECGNKLGNRSMTGGTPQTQSAVSGVSGARARLAKGQSTRASAAHLLLKKMNLRRAELCGIQRLNLEVFAYAREQIPRTPSRTAPEGRGIKPQRASAPIKRWSYFVGSMVQLYADTMDGANPEDFYNIAEFARKYIGQD